jgi:hypothetical protein
MSTSARLTRSSLQMSDSGHSRRLRYPCCESAHPSIADVMLLQREAVERPTNFGFPCLGGWRIPDDRRMADTLERRRDKSLLIKELLGLCATECDWADFCPERAGLRRRDGAAILLSAQIEHRCSRQAQDEVLPRDRGGRLSIARIDVIFCETSKPTKWVID